MKAPVEPGLYRHYKGGVYRVLFVAKHHETEREFVVYVSLANGGVRMREAHGDDVDAWTRPVAEHGGGSTARFTRIGD